MTLAIPDGLDAADMDRFLASFLYHESAFQIDEIVEVDRESSAIRARLDTNKALPISSLQRVQAGHPAHVAAAEIRMLTGSLGFLHAWIFHGCRWDEGWSGFGNRIHRADFKDRPL